MRILEEAPQALATQLRSLPHPATAQRLVRQFSPGTALRIAAVLGGVAVADLEALIGEWRVVLAATRRPEYTTGREAGAGSSREPAVESFLELRSRNLDVLVDAEAVGELKSLKPNVVLSGELQNVLFACAGRITNSRSLFRRHERNPVGVWAEEGSRKLETCLLSVNQIVHILHQIAAILPSNVGKLAGNARLACNNGL